VLTRAQQYDYNTANLRAVSDALDQVGRVGKEALRRSDQAAILTATRLYALLLAAATETALLKMLYEPPVPSQVRDRVLQVGTQQGQWLEAIETGFRRSYKVGEPRSLENLDPTPRFRREVLRGAVSNDLRGVIEMRNALAHGQWSYAFNSGSTNVSQSMMKELRTENLHALEHKRAIVGALGSAVQDLLVSPATFERDFDVHVREVERRRSQLQASDFKGYVGYLKRRHERRRKYLSSDPNAAT